jgi:prefoldin subunit 5
MRNPFQWTPEEQASATGSEQLDMLTRLVDFINESLTDIKKLQTDVNTVKDDIEEIKNPTTPK